MWTKTTIGSGPAHAEALLRPHLILVFGSSKLMQLDQTYAAVRALYPEGDVVGCSTAGEICGISVHDDTVVITAIRFHHTSCRVASVDVDDYPSSTALGLDIVSRLEMQGLTHVILFSDGLYVNGTHLVNGVLQGIPSHVSLTGGLSGDADRFKETYVMCNGTSRSKSVACVGLYGNGLSVGYGSMGGWDPFGLERVVTKSKGNILFELDGQPALETYKKYLGSMAASLPASGLFYPLSLRVGQQEKGIVRTILAVDESARSITFAGDIPEGAYARLMKANTDRLIDGALIASKIAKDGMGERSCELAILISCVGRKLVLTQRVEEEVEAVQDILGHQSILTGFYSYGEISPFRKGETCELHNQTMTITLLSELSQ